MSREHNYRTQIGALSSFRESLLARRLGLPMLEFVLLNSGCFRVFEGILAVVVTVRWKTKR